MSHYSFYSVNVNAGILARQVLYPTYITGPMIHNSTNARRCETAVCALLGRCVPVMDHLSEMHVPEGDRGATGRHRRPYRGPRGQLACGRKSGEWRLRIFGFLVRLLFVAKL